MKTRFYLMGVEPWEQYTERNRIQDVKVTPTGIDQGIVFSYNPAIHSPTELLDLLVEHDAYAELTLDEFLCINSRITAAFHNTMDYQAKWN